MYTATAVSVLDCPAGVVIVGGRLPRAEPPVSRVPVVAAVIDRDGRYLLGLRPAHKRHGGLWEFPGGKMKEGEDYLRAVRRELEEELEMTAESVGRELLCVPDDGSPFVIHFVEVKASGIPVPLEHTEVGWFGLEELVAMPLAPSDARFVRYLAGGDG
jgi:8-oxo-dGTP pyrophosphatase MutT (NUDIX family)